MIKKIIFSVLSFICALLFFNFYFLLAEISNPSDLIDDNYEGRKWNPGQYYSYSAESYSMGNINEYGYLGPAYPIDKKSNTLRVVLLGDSYAAGRQVKDKYHFRNILEDLLRKNLDKNVEVLNFGLDGISFRTMYLKYLLTVSKYNPDVIIFFINTPKIFREDKYLLPKLYIENDSVKINFDFNKTDYAKTRQNLSFLRKSGYISLLEKVYANFSDKRFLKLIFDKNYKGEDIFVDSVKFKDEPVENVNMVRYILRELQKLQNDSKLIYFMPNSQIQDDVQKMIGEYNLKVLNPFDYVKKHGEDYREIVYWPVTNRNGHLNYRGHEMIAHFLFDELIKDVKYPKVFVDK